jgi:hypothetical protein
MMRMKGLASRCFRGPGVVLPADSILPPDAGGTAPSSASAAEAPPSTFFVQPGRMDSTDTSLIKKYHAGWLCKYQRLACHRNTCLTLIVTWILIFLLSMMVLFVKDQRTYYEEYPSGINFIRGTLAINTVCLLAHFFVVSKFRPYCTRWNTHNNFDQLSYVTEAGHRKMFMVQRINLLWSEVYERNRTIQTTNEDFKLLLTGDPKLKQKTDEKWLSPKLCNFFVAFMFIVQLGALFVMLYSAHNYSKPTMLTQVQYNITTKASFSSVKMMPAMSKVEMLLQALWGVRCRVDADPTSSCTAPPFCCNSMVL